MPRQRALNFEQDGRQFRMTLKRDFLGDPPVVLLALSVAGFVFCLSITKWGVFFLFVACLYKLFHDLMLTRTVTIDAGTVRVDHHYGPLFDPEIVTKTIGDDFDGQLVLFFRQLRDYCFLSYSPRIYCRKNLHVPVTRVVFLCNEQDKNRRRSIRKYRYEIRIPLSETGGHGIVVTHPSEEAMYEFESQIKAFWQATPYYDEVWYEANPAAALRRHEEEPNRFETPPFYGARPMLSVTIIEEEKSVSIVSQYGDAVSSFIARTLYGLRCLTSLVMLLVFLGLLGGFIVASVFWDDVEAKVQPYLEKAEPKAIAVCEKVAEHAINRLPIDRQTKDDWIAETKNEFPNRPQVAVVTCVIGGYFAIGIGLSVLFLFLRWPFWKRWKVRLEDYALRRHRVYSDWYTDRSHFKRPVYQYDKFLDAIAATPRTNRLITCKPLFCRDPGWYFPLQVVIITPEGALPIPVNSEEEQEEVITVLKRFVAGSRFDG